MTNQEQRRDALDAMIAAVEHNLSVFEGTEDERYILRVLEDLRLLRDASEATEPPRLAPKGAAKVIKEVRQASGVGLREAKRICEEAGWYRETALSAAIERRDDG
jgi:ribosomal protein L7/L12